MRSLDPPVLKGARIAIAGGGVFGLAVAVELAHRGAAVTLYDPQPRIRSASGMAAGMLAPAFEAALDAASQGHFSLLRTARELWPALAERLAPKRPVLDLSGALFLAGPQDLAAMEALQRRMTALGATVETLDSEAAHRLQADVAGDLAGAVFTPEDWRIDPRRALPALARALRRAGGRVKAAAVGERAGRFTLSNGDKLEADVVVIAAGAESASLAALAPELSLLQPIKGQLLRFEDAGPAGGPTLRSRGGYVSPQAGGAVVGATMEPGLSDRRLDEAILERLKAEAVRWLPQLAVSPIRGAAGVRAATPDGLPLIGPSSRPKVILATGARRNGWLLAPLAAQVVAGHLAGDAPDETAAAVDPRRFAV